MARPFPSLFAVESCLYSLGSRTTNVLRPAIRHERHRALFGLVGRRLVIIGSNHHSGAAGPRRRRRRADIRAWLVSNMKIVDLSVRNRAYETLRSVYSAR